MTNQVEPDQQLLSNLVGMGFDEERVKIALKMTNNNGDIASHILSEHGMLEQLQSQIENGINPFNNNPSQPQVNQQLTEEHVIQMMEQNPQAFQQLLADISQHRPEIANLVQSDPQAFISLLTQILNQVGMPPLPNDNSQQSINNENTDIIEQPEQMPELSQHVRMSEEEHNIMERLSPMFPHLPQVTILETLRACGNNEEMTANLLFEY